MFWTSQEEMWIESPVVHVTDLIFIFERKGNLVSTNITSREIKVFCVFISRHKYPLWISAYPAKQQTTDRASSLLWT